MLPASGACGENSPGSGAFKLERHVHLGAIGLDLPLGVELHIELDDLRDAKVTQRFRGLLDRVAGCLFPGFDASTDQFNNLVDALRHVVLPFGVGRKQVLPARIEPSTTASADKLICLTGAIAKILPSRSRKNISVFQYTKSIVVRPVPL